MLSPYRFPPTLVSTALLMELQLLGKSTLNKGDKTNLNNHTQLHACTVILARKFGGKFSLVPVCGLLSQNFGYGY